MGISLCRHNIPLLLILSFLISFLPNFIPIHGSKIKYKIIKNIVFINNPEICYIKPEDIERFKRLAGLECFLLDRDSARLHTYVNGEILYNVAVQEVESNGKLPPPRASHGSQNASVKPVSSVPYNGTPVTYSYIAPLPAEVDTRIEERFEPGLVFLPSLPNREDWANIVTATRSGSALIGTEARGHIGPVIRLMDIGECEDSYLFVVSLPGVKRDESKLSSSVKILTFTGYITAFHD